MARNPRRLPTTRFAGPGAAAVDPADPLGRVRGRRVVNLDGLEIGEVAALFVDPRTGRVRFLRVAAGGVLGIGKAYTLIPAEAVVEVDDERVLVDPDPDRLLGSPSYLSAGRPRWDIPPETRVVAADGEEIGAVIEVHPGFLVVEHGVYFPHDLYVPNDAIAHYDGHTVRLALPRAKLLHRGWDEAPPTLVRVSSAPHRAPSEGESR
jgi:sporulation protein YlmC with PRC-barrel domain